LLAVSRADCDQQERGHSRSTQDHRQQDPADNPLRGALLFGARPGDAKCVDERLGEPGQQLHTARTEQREAEPAAIPVRLASAGQGVEPAIEEIDRLRHGVTACDFPVPRRSPPVAACRES